MKRFLSKMAAFFLAILVLFSSSFVAIDSHLCCGIVVDSSIFGKANVCKMDMVSCKLENTSMSILKNSCCYNNIDYKYSELFNKNIPVNVDLQKFNFTPNFNFTATSDLFIESEFSNNHFKDYLPPLITRDILVLVQRFLI